MKHSIILSIVAFAMAITSCIEVEDLTPGSESREIINPITGTEEIPGLDGNPSSDLVVNQFNLTGTFNTTSQFNLPLDIDGDGNTDFTLVGESLHNGSMSMNTVYLIGNQNNKVIKEEGYAELCNNTVNTVPIQRVTPSTGVNATSEWYNVGVLYLNVNSEDCNAVRNYSENGRAANYGLKFYIDGSEHYGWLNIKTSSIGRMGYPECSEHWTVRKAVYNPVANQGV